MEIVVRQTFGVRGSPPCNGLDQREPPRGGSTVAAKEFSRQKWFRWMTEEINVLEHSLGMHFLQPQKSERWTTYCLIAPVVTAALQDTELSMYYEWNQVSQHGTTQSVDIAVLDQGNPVVLVEAKRFDRQIDAGMIQKY
jgi:hypothetical protein